MCSTCRRNTPLSLRRNHPGSRSKNSLGLPTANCYFRSVLTALSSARSSIVVADGTATFERRSADDKPVGPEIIHQIHLLSLQGEFAEVLDADMVLTLSEEE